MAIMKDLFHKRATPEEIAILEAGRNIKLPVAYKKFLLENNGGEPEPNYFDIPDLPGKGSLVDYFNGLGVSTPYGNLEAALDTYRDRLPDGFIAIGADPGGNVLCLGIKMPHLDKLYYWDHHDELDKRGRSKKDMGNMYWLADDIYEFLDNLREMPQEE